MTRKRTRNDRDRRPRTVSISLRDRGQTTQDFAVGIGVFILAVAFVFSFLPTILTPFDSTVSGGQTAQVDRIADRLVHNLSTGDNPNEISWSEFQNYNDSNADDEVLAEEFGLRTNDNGNLIDQVNVSIQTLEREPIGEMADNTVGRTYGNQSAASSARIVTVDENLGGDCDPACRLVVRIW